MRYYFIIALLSVGLGLSASECSKCEVDSIIMIYSSNWYIATDIPTSNSDFVDMAKQRFSITDTDIIKRFMKELESIKPIKNKRPNVRCKIYIFSGDSIAMTISCSIGNLLYKGQTYEFSDSLFSLVDGIVNTSEWTIPSREEFPLYSNHRITEDEQINQLLKSCFYSQRDSIPEGNYHILVVCTADIYGNTLDVRFHDMPSWFKEKEEDMKSLFVKYLKWNYNPERSPMETYLFSITLSNERERKE